MDWMDELNAELHQAQLKANYLQHSITLYRKEISITERDLADKETKYDIEMDALRRMKNATIHDLRTRKSKLWRLWIEHSKELSTVKRSIKFNKELQQSQNRVDLRTLPPEIREIILKFLLVKDVLICIPVCDRWSGRQKYNLGIFLACKQLRKEAYNIFYGYNTFGIGPRYSFDNLPKCLRQIKVKVDSDTKIRDLLKAIESNEQLQSLSIEILEVPTYRGSRNPSTLHLLKFKKPQSLQRISVACTATLANVKDARTILEDVLKKGCYRSGDQGHTGRARIKGQRFSRRLS